MRCLTLSQFDEAEAALAEDGSLYYVLNVTETKQTGSCLTLTQRRKQQVQRYINDIRSSIIGHGKGVYVFGQGGGEKMVSICILKCI